MASVDVKRLPVYYIGHGAPTLVIDRDEKTHKFLKKLGTDILGKFGSSLKGIVVVSAHWESSDVIRVGSFKDETPLIYDFGGFPEIMYQQQYKSKGSPELASRIVDMLDEAGIRAVTDSKRGFDHGTWVPLKIAIPEPGETPIVQVSLKRPATFEQHLKVGRALSPLRDEGILIIGSGSLVHNLREFFTNFGVDTKPASYTKRFDKDVSAIVSKYKGEELGEKLIELKNHPELAKAHPRDEHLVPLHVIAGAAGDDVGEKIHDEAVIALSSSAFRWGESESATERRTEL